MPEGSNVWVFFGLIGSGKSTLAAAWAAHRNTGHFNSDRLRKELAGISPTGGCQEPLNRGIYSSNFTRLTYDALLAKCEAECLAGRSVVLDASYQNRDERDRLRALADRLGVDVFFILCNCPEDEIMRRLEIRRRDTEAVSDGDQSLYLAQKERFEFPEELSGEILINLSTDRNINELLDQLDKIYEVENHA